MIIAVAGGDNIADKLLAEFTAAAKGGRGTLDPGICAPSRSGFHHLERLRARAGWTTIPTIRPRTPLFDIVKRTGWKELKAVKNRNLYELAHAMNRSIYSFYACLKMATLFYPDDFKDVDPEADDG